MSDPIYISIGGKKKDIAWINSSDLFCSYRLIHLVNQRGHIRAELEARGYWNDGCPTLPEITETFAEMCWTRALIDLKMGNWCADLRLLRRRRPPEWMTNYSAVAALAIHYRLTKDPI